MIKKTHFILCIVGILAGLICLPAGAQETPDGFDPTTEDFNVHGPWSDLDLTTITAPKVSLNSINLDGSVSSAEYGGFEGIMVMPGVNAWILDYPDTRSTDGAADTNFEFYVAHDNDFLYIGVIVADDVVRSNDPNASFWKDDAVELLIDGENWKYDQNYDQNKPAYGGHPYVNYEGRFSEWDDDLNAVNDRGNYTPGVLLDDGTREFPGWSYGPDGEVYGVGGETDTGWSMEVKFAKSTIVSPDSGIVLDDGYMMGFNIGLDDDDGSDMELQYFWANREYAVGWNEEEFLWFTDEELANRGWLDPDITPYNFAITSDGRLKSGGAGDLIFEGSTGVDYWDLF